VASGAMVTLWSVSGRSASTTRTFPGQGAPASSSRRTDNRIGSHPVVMGMHKAVYVRDADAELWARAERYAKARRMPVSGLVMAALEAYLDDKGDDDGR
jgi:hypothetical protein